MSDPAPCAEGAESSLTLTQAYGYLGLSDRAEARRWYERAVLQGHAEAVVELKHLDWLEHSAGAPE